MKIAFTTKEPTWDSMMEARFGRAEYVVLYDEESGDITIHNNADIAAQEHGAGPKMAQAMADLKADVIITGNGPGENAHAVLSKMGTTIFVGAGEISVSDAYKAYQENRLEKF
ncbi:MULTISPECIES: NifB/NifX family molybdenum-iron cluster-binding protein [unclassified Sulfurospirillum]|uniref:NifB/NifX family molybdenum-iron cluster-binding protein n=1 Tax=unclassified Sulfurospirillum TaxID=2618290 RepID=UPI0005071C05|nr:MULTISPECIES: NifB/NifX family molybdenum-iron cluster-binding protein [unclassified Sulfurospirillum]KFL34166.1 dinitrogenase iron-molybdenum cofactor biosynthesis protein [Sulfurospirillum sp. SCADC]